MCRIAPILVSGLTLMMIVSPMEALSPGTAAQRVIATRLPQNPLISVDSSPSIGDNVNGPTVIRVPPWVKAPLGRYYMYFAHHQGKFIRLAYSDAIGGPWKIYEPGVLHVRDTLFHREQPDPPNSPKSFYTHVASPEIYVDPTTNKILMWFHGWWTNNERWPLGSVTAAYAWARERGYGQFTQVAESNDGLHFEVRKPVTRDSYLRVFRWQDYFYGMMRLGRLARSRDPLAEFELGANPFRDTLYRDRVRHVALLRRGPSLHMFFSAIGDSPERILMSTIDLRESWATWKASIPIEVLQPETDYECVSMPSVPSEIGDIEGRARQLRDPAVFEENGRAWLFYSICGEQGIAVAELKM
jgi:hypothetical protein